MNDITIKVPATAANLGPGFDCLGCALTLYSYITFSKNSQNVEITGCEKKYSNKNNLIYLAYKSTLDYLKIDNKNVSINIDSKIPIARGLGSSATMLVAGAVGAYVLNDVKIDKNKILEITNKIEGHPDNLAPAIFGGLTASLVENNKPIIRKFIINKNWKFITLIPNFRLSTKKSREVMPKEITKDDAIYNISRIPLLINSLAQGDQNLLHIALNDKIHQPYRKVLIDHYDDIQKIANDNKIPFCLSGAGPTLLLIVKNNQNIQNVIEKINETVKNKWTIKNLDIDDCGFSVVENH